MHGRRAAFTIAVTLVLLTHAARPAPVRASAHAPAPHEWEAVRHALLVWANGVATSDTTLIATVLHDSFPDRDRYLGSIQRSQTGSDVVMLRYARGEFRGDTVRVAPLVVVGDGGTFKQPLGVTLVKTEGTWRIRSVEFLSELPPELVRRLPEHEKLHRVDMTVHDAETGAPLVTRVSVLDSAGEYWPPDGHMKYPSAAWRQDVGGDVLLDGRTWAYVEGEFGLSLPEGWYTVEVSKGIEYEPARVEFSVDAGGMAAPQVRLQRWIDMRAEGWYSGDTHVHFMDPQTAILEMRGEDLSIVNILATKWGELVTNVEHFTGTVSAVSSPDAIVYVGEEARHAFLGHTILLNLERLVYPLSWGPPGPGVPGGFDWPPMAHIADEARAQGGLVSWAHFPGPPGELAVDFALNKIDAVDLMTWGDAFSEEGRGPPARTWYRLLNVGFDVPALGGTDKMQNWQVVGGVRTYVSVDGPLTYQRWIDGIRAGRTFVTTGPMLTMTADGQEVGSRLEKTAGDQVAVRAHVRSRIPVDRIEIVSGGVVIAARENPERLQELVLEVGAPISHSTWLAARAYSSRQVPANGGMPLMAHTSPVYVDVGGAPRRSADDARFFLDLTDRGIAWARDDARFQHEHQREVMIELFQRAREFYAEQVGEGLPPPSLPGR